MEIKLVKLSSLATCPQRAHYNDSGADCYASKSVLIKAGTIEKIPTGIAVDIPDGYDIVIHCKSGLASRGIFSLNAPIDAGYTGEIFAIIYNAGRDDYLVRVGEKIGQFVVRQVIYASFVENLSSAERGSDGFGSTGL